MKRWFVAATAALLILTVAAPAMAHMLESEWQATLAGQDYMGMVYHHSEQHRTYMDSSKLADLLGAKVVFDPGGELVTVTKGSNTIQFKLKEKAGIINGKSQETDVSAYARDDGSVILPIRFIAENLGYTVAWHADRNHVSVN